MNKPRLRLLLVFFLLTLLWLSPLASPTTYAAGHRATQPYDLTSCSLKVPANTGISSDATEYFPTSSDAPVGQQRQPLGRFNGSNTPQISAWMCQSGEVVLRLNERPLADWINVSTTVNRVTTITTPAFTLNEDNDAEIRESVQADQQYSFQVQYCSRSSSGLIVCSAWSPHLLEVTAANSSCVSGYVWREAVPFDHVCVQPWEATQAAFDNSQTAARGNPNPTVAHPCFSGYVWREAWGGDYVCVDPAQRDQVVSDNSQALARIAQL